MAWVGEIEGALGAVVSDRKAQEFGRDGVGFDEVETGKARDEIVVVVAILVLDAKIVNDYDERDGTGDMTKQTGGGGFKEARLRQERDKTNV